MITLATIIDLVKTGMGFFLKTKTVQQDSHQITQEGQIETNKEEIEKTTIHWRNFLGFVLATVVLWNWILVPLLGVFGVAIAAVPVQQIIQILLVMIGN
ncbi:hypothetical protein RJ495_005112 [Pluralibacter gergoviae]|nr:hypothetical protein [Pluralibacter gergoviae]ELD4303998.1 hypothetical protein [Pluralibacter gergoviae]